MSSRILLFGYSYDTVRGEMFCFDVVKGGGCGGAL